jgi:hypothetical protein
MVKLTRILMQHVDAGEDVAVHFGVATRTEPSKDMGNRLILLHHRHFLGGEEGQTPVDEAIASMDPSPDSTLIQIPGLFNKDQHRTAAAHRLHGFCRGHTTTFLELKAKAVLQCHTNPDNKGRISLGLRPPSLGKIQWYKLSTWTGLQQKRFPKSR